MAPVMYNPNVPPPNFKVPPPPTPQRQLAGPQVMAGPGHPTLAAPIAPAPAMSVQQIHPPTTMAAQVHCYSEG